MKVNVLLFAHLRERFGKESEMLILPQGTRVKEIPVKLFGEKGRSLFRSICFAVDDAYVSPETILKEGDTVALIPPVAGG